MKNFIEEFKAFALKGNVIDLAVAVVIGTAFGKIVESFVNDLIMPAIGLIGKFDFATLVLKDQVKIGLFINNVVNFAIVAFVVFIAIKALNKLTKKDIASTTQK